MRGHAVEARLYAEDFGKGFHCRRSGGWTTFVLPADLDVRIDSGVAAGGEITPFYDPMIAKVIAHGS